MTVPPVTSLRARLFGVWLMSLLACVVVGVLLLELYRQSSAGQIARAEAELTELCARIEDGHAFYIADWSGDVPPADDPRLQRELDAIAAFVRPQGAEAGILRDPRAADGGLSALAAASLATGEAVQDRRDLADGLELTRVCPLPGPIPDLVGWARLRRAELPGATDLRRGLATLLALMLALSAGLAVLVRGWSARIGQITAALGAPDGHALPQLAPTGAPELDLIVAALNDAGRRLAIAQQESAAQSTRAAAAERMAGLGRVAAGVAHEIRNPLAAMRLRAESGLAGDESRRRSALGAILAQIDRLDRLSAELLAMTARSKPHPEVFALDGFLAAIARDHEGQGAAIRVDAPADRITADPAMLRRALDNLVQNAQRATKADGEIRLHARLAAGQLRIDITDTGPGIDPAISQRLFEPFVTTRPDGTGLGLAIAREMVQAHGGGLHAATAPVGAHFILTLPQPTSPAA